MIPLRFVCAAAGLLALAACGNSEPTPATPEPHGSQRIVFVGPQFDIWSVQEDGGNPERLTGASETGESRESGTSISLRPQQAQSVRYTWPTWSPDSRFVALSRTPGSGPALASLMLLDTEDATERQLHETRPGSVGLVANGAPHYALWAPDSRHLSFVAPRGPGQGLGLYSIEPENGEPYEVAANAPLYHVWSPDGTYILTHRREQLLLHDTGDRSTRDLDADSFRYRVPAFSPDGERIAYVVDEGGAGSLVTSRLDGTDRVSLMSVLGVAAFGYAPSDGRLAVVKRPLSKPSYDELYVVNEDGTGVEEPLVRGALAAFYWSPDGSRIAYVTLDDGIAWHILVPATGETRPLTRFIPTPDYLTHLQFFDQFAPSHLVWSADSTKLVFAGVLDRTESPRVWLVDTTGNESPRPVAEGRLAFWAPPATG